MIDRFGRCPVLKRAGCKISLPEGVIEAIEIIGESLDPAKRDGRHCLANPAWFRISHHQLFELSIQLETKRKEPVERVEMLAAKRRRQGPVNFKEKRHGVEIFQRSLPNIEPFGHQVVDEGVDRKNPGRDEASLRELGERSADKVGGSFSGEHDHHRAEIVCTARKARDDFADQTFRCRYDDMLAHDTGRTWFRSI